MLSRQELECLGDEDARRKLADDDKGLPVNMPGTVSAPAKPSWPAPVLCDGADLRGVKSSPICAGRHITIRASQKAGYLRRIAACMVRQAQQV